MAGANTASFGISRQKAMHSSKSARIAASSATNLSSSTPPIAPISASSPMPAASVSS
jgi:hypothetical protein